MRPGRETDRRETEPWEARLGAGSFGGTKGESAGDKNGADGWKGEEELCLGRALTGRLVKGGAAPQFQGVEAPPHQLAILRHQQGVQNSARF